jgi:hypothetical protein
MKNPNEALGWVSHKQITVHDVDMVVLRIAQLSDHDYEAAHGLEDDLYHALMLAYVEGWPRIRNPKLAIKAALRTKSLSFPRYSA